MTFDTNSPNFAAVKSAVEIKYESMDLDCTDVAGLVHDDGEHLLKAICDDDKPEDNLKPILVGFVSGLAGSVVFATAVVNLLKKRTYTRCFLLSSFSENHLFTAYSCSIM